jgi:hypothetical protein
LNVTVNEHRLLLPQLSEAVHVTVWTPGEDTSEGGSQTIVGLGSWSSTASALKKSRLMTEPGQRQFRTMLLGQVMTGGVVSAVTRTRKVQTVRLVQSSVAVQATVVVPIGKTLPDGGAQVIVTLVSALSVAVILVGKWTAVPFGEQATTLRLPGQSISGGVVSCASVTLNEQVSCSPQELVAVQFTVVVPRMNSPPDGGVQFIIGRKLQFPAVVAGVGYVTNAVLATPQIQFV